MSDDGIHFRNTRPFEINTSSIEAEFSEEVRL
jgi:hypothetical protein